MHGVVDAQRAAWLAKFAREPEPWRGPVHAAPLLDGLAGRIVELGAGGGKVGAALPVDALALDWAALPPGRPRAFADVRALPLRAACADALVALHVLGHLDARGRVVALAEWARVLRPEGALALEVFAVGDARAGLGDETERGSFVRAGIETHYFEEPELRALLAQARFEGALVAETRRARWGERRVLRGLFTKRAHRDVR